ncbi:MAG: C40 family peptidase [Elusimicrobia bacterium]|nr:C40 family peptidase [Elusimicrobiota bacterium]
MLRPVAAAGLASLLVAASGCGGGAGERRRKPAVPATPLAKAVVRTAKSYLPEEEKNLKTPKDCSDYVRRVFAANGVELPRTAVEMSLLGDRVASSRDLRMADLVLFSGEKADRRVGHVGIYASNGIFIHLPSSKVVAMESLYSDYYRKRYLGARRILP